jgi:hypothetical protein
LVQTQYATQAAVRDRRVLAALDGAHGIHAAESPQQFSVRYVTTEFMTPKSVE